MAQNIIKPEVLAPAGDLSRLKAAVDFGADAVYIGGKEFSMRSAPMNFDKYDMLAGVKYAHEHGAKVYLTCNTLPKCEEVERMPEYFEFVKNSGIDAVIANDIGVLSLIKKHMPNMEIHISTQAGIVNHVTASEFYKMGAKRVVLARELPFEEIKYIREHTPKDLEIECFVHGAMCVSFSGRCLLSSYIIGRDANRGECAQPCRWNYSLVEEKRPGEHYPIIEDEKGTYILNAKDMCMVEHIHDLVEAGITSLKIEGRAKSDYYVSVVTNAYRMAVDDYLKNPSAEWKCPEWITREVTMVSHRRYCTGFYYGPIQNGQYYETGGYVRNADVVAVVDSWKNGVAYCTQRNKFLSGDTVELLQPKSEPITLTINSMKNELGEPIENTAHAMMKFSFNCETPLKQGTIVRKEK